MFESECQECGRPLDTEDFSERHNSIATVDEEFGVVFVTDTFSRRGPCPYCNTYNSVEELNESEISLKDYRNERILDNYYRELAGG